MTAAQPAETRIPVRLIAGPLALALLGVYVLFAVHFMPGCGLLLLALVLTLAVVPIRWNPLTRRKIKRFKEIRRGYFSFLILVALAVASLFAELIANGRALAVRYEGNWFFPTYGAVVLGSAYGLDGVNANIPVNYRQLAARFAAEGGANRVWMPPIPFSPNEQNTWEGVLKPRPPAFADQHYLGTDSTGRDILSRAIYGFRIAIFFALSFMVLVYLIGITVGCLMGYFGGLFDLLVQRLIEIWSLVPFIYMVIIIFSVIPTSFAIPVRIAILLGIMVLFSWTGMTYYMRTATYREKARDYTAAAQVIGAGTGRIIFSHILPNAVSTVVTFMPFTIASAITAVTALDFLGFGLPPPTPSIGEILKQGTARLDAPWIVSSAFAILVSILTLVTFVGEAVREAFDPRKFTLYR
jgi:microcin C transport system permease protein